MSNRTQRFILLVNNFSGISFFKYKDRELQISKPIIFVNVLNTTTISVSIFLLFTREDFMERYLVSEVSSISTSMFSKLLVLVGSGLLYVVTAIICISHVLKRKQILNFLKDCLTLVQKNQSFHVIEKVFMRNLILIVTYVTFMLVGVTMTVTKNSWFAFAFCYVAMQPYTVMFCFLNFIKMSEMFFLICFKDFRENLKLLLGRDSHSASECRQLILQYDRIFRINQNFNKIFGLSLSLITSCLAIGITTQVKTCNY